MKTTAAWPLAALSLCMLLPSLGTSIANVALPTLAQAFDASFGDVQWVVLAYLIANVTVIVSVGRLGDIVGRRRLLGAGIVLFTVSSLACGLAGSLWMLIAARGVQGLGSAILMALTMALVGDAVPRERTGSAMGLLGTMSAVGTALGPSLGGALIAAQGWPAIFLVNVPLGIGAWLLVRRHLPADAAAALKPGTGIGRLMWEVTLATYARFRDPALRASLAMTALVSAVMMATLIVGPFYLSRALALATAIVGLVMSVGPVATALTGIPAGRIVDRFGAERMAMAGLAGMAVACLGLAFVPTGWGVPGYLVPLVLLTPSYALFQAANNTAVMREVAAHQRGAVSGMLNLSRTLGLVGGASVLGAVFTFASGTPDVAQAAPHAVASAMSVTFAVAAVLVMVALAVAALNRRPRRAA